MQVSSWILTCPPPVQVHTFTGLGAAVRCCADSPALDVVALGLADGRVTLLNLKFDRQLATFVHDPSGGAVMAVAFNAGSGAPLLAVGGANGAVSFWDLEKGKLHSLLKEAHDHAVRWVCPNRPWRVCKAG